MTPRQNPTWAWLIPATALLWAVACGGAPNEGPIPAPEATAGGAEPQAPGEGSTIPIPAAHLVTPDLLIGGQPTEEHLRQASDGGYRTIISLRTEGEPGTEGEREFVEQEGMQFVHLPVEPGTGVTADNARALGAALAEASDAPVVLHCGSGARVAALLAIRAFLDEALSIDEALARMHQWGLPALEGEVRDALQVLCEANPDRSC